MGNYRKDKKNLREDQELRDKKNGISPDLTRKEREVNAMLREQLQKKRQEAGRWFLSKERIQITQLNVQIINDEKLSEALSLIEEDYSMYNRNSTKTQNSYNHILL